MSEIIKVLNRASSALSNVMQRHPGYEFSELRTLLAGAVGSVAALEADNARMKAELEAVGAGGVQRLAAAPQAVQAAVPVDAVTDLKNALADAVEIRQQLRLMEEHARGDVWRWQADAANELASMGNRMGVLILASDLRNLLASTQPAAQGMEADLTDEQIDEAFNQMPDGAAGFLKSWGYRQFARAVLAAQAKQGGV